MLLAVINDFRGIVKTNRYGTLYYFPIASRFCRKVIVSVIDADYFCGIFIRICSACSVSALRIDKVNSADILGQNTVRKSTYSVFFAIVDNFEIVSSELGEADETEQELAVKSSI